MSCEIWRKRGSHSVDEQWSEYVYYLRLATHLASLILELIARLAAPAFVHCPARHYDLHLPVLVFVLDLDLDHRLGSRPARLGRHGWKSVASTNNSIQETRLWIPSCRRFWHAGTSNSSGEMSEISMRPSATSPRDRTRPPAQVPLLWAVWKRAYRTRACAWYRSAAALQAFHRVTNAMNAALSARLRPDPSLPAACAQLLFET